MAVATLWPTDSDADAIAWRAKSCGSALAHALDRRGKLVRFPMRVIAIAIAASLVTLHAPMPASAQTPVSVSTRDREAVTMVVTEFGKRLRMVAVLAPKEAAAKAMEEAYSGLVAPDLLAAWKQDPKRAPGKRTSSPSPERIDISAIKAKGQGAYAVAGKVILLTAQERRQGGVFQANPVAMTVAQRHGKWVISAYRETEAPP
jgi:hypothetical protein